MKELLERAIANTNNPEYFNQAIPRANAPKTDATYLEIGIQSEPIAPGTERSGADVSDIIRMLIPIYESSQEKAPCAETKNIIGYLQCAVNESARRDLDRANRGVEGT